MHIPKVLLTFVPQLRKKHYKPKNIYTMRMTNQNVIIEFIKGNNEDAQSHNGNLWITANSQRLMNYGTCLAERLPNGTFLVNCTRYSVTTSKIQGYVRYELAKRAKTRIHLDGIPRGQYELYKYNKEQNYHEKNDMWNEV